MLELRPAAAHGCSEHHKAPTDDADPDDQPPLHLHPIPTVISTAQSTYPTHPSGGDFMKYMWQPSMRLILLNLPRQCVVDQPEPGFSILSIGSFSYTSNPFHPSSSPTSMKHSTSTASIL